jgi:UDP-N-acetylmuramoylalanine-D-glutamate ligase
VPIIGAGQGGDLRDLRPAADSQRRVAIGETARQFAKPATSLRCRRVDADAVRAAKGARPGGTVVLAPACEFDVSDYAERGRVFKEEVARLAADERQSREA